jgi:hypothetical protein
VTQPDKIRVLGRDVDHDTALDACVEFFKRIRVLMREYGCDPDDEGAWMMFAIRLAVKHHPGVKPELLQHRKGRKATKEKLGDDIILYGEGVEAEETGKSVRARMRYLANNHPDFKGAKPETLRLRYQKLKNTKTPEGARLRSFLRWVKKSGLADELMEQFGNEEWEPWSPASGPPKKV